jgi:hypothetical protein
MTWRGCCGAFYHDGISPICFDASHYSRSNTSLMCTGLAKDGGLGWRCRESSHPQPECLDPLCDRIHFGYGEHPTPHRPHFPDALLLATGRIILLDAADVKWTPCALSNEAKNYPVHQLRQDVVLSFCNVLK